ncbi:general substrate transporter [Hypoxylon sp. NC1633]|nr:general substrate transporter [Hypoxylon sp. NC1633]
MSPPSEPPSRPRGWLSGRWSAKRWFSKERVIVIFSSLAIGLYGYDQGMMSMVNTNHSYLRTMGLREGSDEVGLIVAIYYIGCAIGAWVASSLANSKGRKYTIIVCLVTTIIGGLIMFVPGLASSASDSTWGGASVWTMVAGRTVLGLGIGGIDTVIPIYSSELTKTEVRGAAMAKEFQVNIFGLLLAFSTNLVFTRILSKESQWAWRIPIAFMQAFPILMSLIVRSLPESPRWLISKGRIDDARRALIQVHGKARADDILEELRIAQHEEDDEKASFGEMLMYSGSQFHPTWVTIMGQINQALTGYGAVSVYGPQIFQLLGLDQETAEYTSLGNYLFYYLMMTVGWKAIDVLGRRKLMVWGSGGLVASFLLLTIMGAISVSVLRESSLGVEIVGSVILYMATAVFGICWLTTVWLIPTEIYPNGFRAKGSAISVFVWGFANFLVTLGTPYGFNHLKYWLFLVFAVTNAFAGWWTWRYSPETGLRSFEENQMFFALAQEEESWVVKKVDGGRFLLLPPKEEDIRNAEEGGAAKGGDVGGGDARDDEAGTYHGIFDLDGADDTRIENASDGGFGGDGTRFDDATAINSSIEGSGGEDIGGESNQYQPSETTPLLRSRQGTV